MAKNTKSAKAAQIPIQTELAKELKQHIKKRLRQIPKNELPENTPVLHVPLNIHDIYNLDPVAAGLATKTRNPITGSYTFNKTNTRGQTLDVHCLRHTFATMLCKAGVTPKIAQELLRHSDIRLTMNTYTHIELEDTAQAINKLPSI